MSDKEPAYGDPSIQMLLDEARLETDEPSPEVRMQVLERLAVSLALPLKGRALDPRSKSALAPSPAEPRAPQTPSVPFVGTGIAAAGAAASVNAAKSVAVTTVVKTGATAASVATTTAATTAAATGTVALGKLWSVLAVLSLGGAVSLGVVKLAGGLSDESTVEVDAAIEAPQPKKDAPDKPQPKASSGVPAVAPAAPLPPDEAYGAEYELVSGARTALDKGKALAALDLLDEHELRYPSGRLAQDRDYLVIRVLLKQRRVTEARERARQFRQDYPGAILQASLESLFRGEPTLKRSRQR